MKNLFPIPSTPRDILPGLVAIAFSLSALQPSSAETDIWLGNPGVTVSTNWSDSANWSGKGVYYNEVRFTGTGTSAPYLINNVLDSTTGPALMPCWRLEYINTNGCYTTLIPDGVTLEVNAGAGQMYVGAGQHSSSYYNVSVPNAAETNAITGAGGTLTIVNTLTIGQCGTAPDSHNIVFDMSGLGTFNLNGVSGSRFLMANAGTGAQRVQGTVYLARTNLISPGNDFQIGFLGGTYTNSMPCAVYLGQTNTILVGSGSPQVVVGFVGCTNGILKFNPAFLGANVPGAYFGSTVGGWRANNFWIGINTNNSNTGRAPGYGLCDFTGGNVTVLANNLELGRAGSAPSSALGVLTFDNGTIDANTVIVGNQTVASGAVGAGIINIGANATLRANTSLTLGAVAGAATAGSGGVINVNGGTLAANLITNGPSTTAALNLTNATLQLLAITAGNTASYNAYVNNLVTGGTTNVIAIALAAAPPGYPFTNTLVKYNGTIGGAGFNFGLSMPGIGWTAYLSNNVANSEIDLVVTAGPPNLVWSGADPSGNWDVGTTANWLFGTTLTTFNQFDFVRFDDSATGTTTVNLTTALTPDGLTVSNIAKTYTFGGNGSLGGALAGGLIKQGAGTLILDETGTDTFSGGVTINGGILQVGNGVDSGGGSLGSASGAVINNGGLVFNRPSTDTISVGNPISGTGALTNFNGTLQLSGANAFSGPVFIASGATLQMGSSTALGTTAGATIVANGATLDLNGCNPNAEPITVQGTGSGSGAIISNSTNDIPVLTAVTLAGDTTFGGGARWDLRGTLSAGGHAYNVTMANGSYCEWRDLSADAALGNIAVNSGTLGWVGSTTAGTGGTLTVAGGATLKFYNGSVNANLAKPVVLNDGSAVANGGGANVISAPINLNGYDTFDVAGTSLTLSGPLSGSGTLYKSSSTGPLVVSGNSPSFVGGVLVYAGKLVLNGLLGGGLTNQSGTTVAGTGTNTGPVDISGALLPADAGAAGTFTAAGGLTLESTARLTNDLSATTTGASDLIRVTGDLTVNGNTLYINPIGGSLESGRPYTVITYTGNLNGSFGGVATVSPSPYTLQLINVTTTSPKQIQVIVTGGASSSLVWNNASGNGEWDAQVSYNWSNLTSHVSPDQFYSLDTVLFDDSITNSPTPSTSIDIAAGQVVSPSVMTNNSSTNYTIGGAGKISGSASIIKQGSSTLTLATVNDFSGPVTILAGKMVAGTNSALGSQTGTLFNTNGGTMDVNGFTLGAKPVMLASAGVGGNGALVNSGGPIYDDGSGLTAVTLAGDTIFGGPTRWDLGGTSGATLSTGGKPYNLSLLGNPVGSANATYWEWYNLNTDTNLANINILAGELGVKGTTTLGNATNTVTIFDGGQMTFWGGSGYAKNFYVKSNATLLVRRDGPLFDLNLTLEGGATFTSVDNAKTFTKPITLLGLVHFQNQNATCTFSNVISGPGGFNWDNYNNQFAFAAANTYTGPTLIGSGLALALVGNGSILNSSIIYFGGTDTNGLRIDVSAKNDQALTLASGQTLMGIGRINGSLIESPGATISPGTNATFGTITVATNVTLNGTTVIKLNGATADRIQAGTGITYGGTLLATNISAAPLAAGNSFKLFSAPSYGGSFAGVAPAQPGSGLKWDLSQLNLNGTLGVAVLPQPVIGNITFSAAGVVVSGTNGTAGLNYAVLMSINVALPTSEWTRLATNVFGSGGTFAFTNAVDASAPQKFYRLQAL